MVSTDAAEGVLLGLACGDALGRPLEFTSGDEIDRQHGTVTEMLADGTPHKRPEIVTDDTDSTTYGAMEPGLHSHLYI
ncbi:ADP-ribosylglycohydrolase family protein [Halorhabdus rudnickae]|uniref:ADP-ribosylglycohydrolase family protein n=1 Tax=Halorhabdus rudnickae TaxID=1775544 RepID=UPI001FCF2024|nr:ADP-ribosylglycohydrolase family protein [Halorhabdus rudnickae]